MISRQFKLFVKVLPDLVEAYYDGRHISALSLEEHNKLHLRTLYPIFTKLIHAGILGSQAGGNDRGYIFNIDPKLITLYDAITAVQRLPYPICSLKHHPSDDDCVACDIITKSLNSMSVKLKKVTLYEIYETYQLKQQTKKKKRLSSKLTETGKQI